MTPNLMPKSWPSDCRVAIIGEAPGADEEKYGQPFVGASGVHLQELLRQAKLPERPSLYLGNVSQHRPPGNKIELFNWQDPEIQNGLGVLREQLQQLKPNIVILCGNIPLKAARDPQTQHPLKPGAFKYKVGNWRGSLFLCDFPKSPFVGLKCISTYHPAYALRDYSVNPLIIFDLKRARSESLIPTLTLPQRSLLTNLSLNEILNRLSDIRTKHSLVALDIEGGLGTMSCISFATSASEAFIVPFYRRDPRGQRYIWSPTEGVQLWHSLALTLEDPLVPKVLQNSLYDRFVLEYGYNIRVAGVIGDTMLSGWEIYSQMKKSLGLQASIWTREPYWKGERLQVEEEE